MNSPDFLFLSRCPNKADQTVMVEGNGLGTSNVFSFNAFEFSGETSAIYLHCKVELCPKEGKSCAPVSRSREEAASPTSDAPVWFLSC